MAPRMLLPRPALLALTACALTIGCDRKPTPAGAPPVESARPVAVSSASAPVVSASAAPARPPSPTTVTATRWLTGLPGGLPATLALLRTEPGGGAVLLNETTGDFLVGTARDEGEQVKVQLPGFLVTIEPPSAVKPGALRWESGPSVALRRAPPVVAPTTPAARQFVTGEGAIVTVSPDERASRAWYEGAPRPGDPSTPAVAPKTPRVPPPGVVLVHDGMWLPAAPGLPAPKALMFGGQTIRPARQEPGRSLGCTVHGWAPRLVGAQEAVVQEAWQSWVRERCAAAGASAVIELSYSLVALLGVNLAGAPEIDTPANPAFRGSVSGDGRTPASASVMPINLLARVTNADGSELVEEALLLDTRAGSSPRLGTLVRPGKGVAAVEQNAVTELTNMASWVPREQRAALVSLASARLTVGPTSVDVVLPLRPVGIALPSRHVLIGPRSTLQGAFTSTPATERLTAALLVDW